MNHRVTAVVFFILSLVAILIGYLLLHPGIFLSCPSIPYSNCISEFWSEGIGSPLYWSTWLLPPLFFGLIFVRQEVFRAWWKTIIWVAIPAFVLIVISPPLPEFLTPDRTEVTALMVKLIVVVSIAVIAWKYWRLRAKPAKAK